jgi:hypothetical protein
VGSDGLAPEEDLPLELVETAPDPVGLADPQGVVEAVPADRARGADRLGPPLAVRLLLFPLEMGRREEHHGLGTAAGGLQLPGLLDSLDGHGTNPRSPSRW